jgi:hypothetical protein
MKIIRDEKDINVITEIIFSEGENQEMCTRMIENIEKERLSRSMKIVYDDEGRLSEVNLSSSDIAETGMKLVEDSIKEHYAYLNNNTNKRTDADMHMSDNQLASFKAQCDITNKMYYSLDGRMPMLPMNQGYDQSKKGLPDFGEIDLTGGEEQQEKN